MRTTNGNPIWNRSGARTEKEIRYRYGADNSDTVMLAAL
jgi:hypothetical protein